MKAFHLDRRNGKLMGVCAGIADYFNIDATVVRIGVVLATLIGGFPWTLFAYGVAAWVADPKPLGLESAESLRTSTSDLRDRMRNIDRRMAEVDRYVVGENDRLAREIEELR